MVDIQIITNSLNQLVKKTYWKIRKPDKISINFDGVNDYIDLGTQSALWSNTAISKFSVSVWIKADQINDGTNAREIFHRGWALPYGFSIYFSSVSEKLFFDMASSVWPNRIVTVIIDYPASLIGQWVHLVVTYDSTLPNNTAVIYINGSKTGLTYGTNGPGEILNNVSAMQLSFNTSDFDGEMKDFRYYHETTLTSDQIDRIYQRDLNSVASVDIPVPSYWLPLWDGVGNPKDRISNTLTGIINGAIWTLPAYEDTTLAQIFYYWTTVKYSGKAVTFYDWIHFGLEPYLDFKQWQVTITEGQTRYENNTDVSYMAYTEMSFDVYYKYPELGPNMSELETLISELQGIWLNYQNHSINGLANVILGDRYYDETLMRQSETSNYEKSFNLVAVYTVQRTQDVEAITLTYDEPDTAGAWRTN